jgi:hypothetical protein
VQDSTDCHPLRKSLFCSEIDGGCGAFLRETHLTTELMELGSKAQSKTEAKGVCTLLCQGNRLIVPHFPLVRIAQEPQRPSIQAMTNYTSVLAIEKSRGAVLLEIVQGYPLGKMRVRIGDSSQLE